MLLVEHDQSQVRRRREDRAAGPDDDFHVAAGNPLPMLVPLDIAHVAVQHGHAVEPGAKPAHGLRRETDFGHEQNRLPAEAHDFLNGLHVDFGFAAAGDAMD